MTNTTITFTRTELSDLCEALWMGKKSWDASTEMRVKLDDLYEDLYEQYRDMRNAEGG
jgi:hypothetical protein